MNNKPNKKLNPYLYPFKMKSEDFLYPQIVFQQSQATRTLKTKLLNPFQIAVKSYWSLHSLQTNPKNLGTRIKMFLVLKKHYIPRDLTQSTESTAVTFLRPKHVNKPQYEPYYKTLNFSKATLTKPVVTTTINRSDPINPYAKPTPRYIIFEGPESKDILTKVPGDVNWTRIDRTQEKQDMIPVWLKVAMGVASGTVATIVVHPLDVIKVRLQLFPKKIATMTMLHRITMCEGTRGLYAGLTAGILRQLTYTGTRLYVNFTLCDKYKQDNNQLPGFSERLQIGAVAGMAGAFMATPSDMALVRMIEVWRLRRSPCSPPCSMACKYVQNPETVFFQLLRIARREGVATWWRGGTPTVLRSLFVTTAQVGVYSEIREAFTKGEYMEMGIKLNLYSAVFSSLISALLSLPVDNVKTRYQSYQERHRRGVDILRDMLRKKGVRYLWKGMLPYYVRQVIHTVITYVLLDQLVDGYVDFQEATLRPKR